MSVTHREPFAVVDGRDDLIDDRDRQILAGQRATPAGVVHRVVAPHPVGAPPASASQPGLNALTTTGAPAKAVRSAPASYASATTTRSPGAAPRAERRRTTAASSMPRSLNSSRMNEPMPPVPPTSAISMPSTLPAGTGDGDTRVVRADTRLATLAAWM